MKSKQNLKKTRAKQGEARTEYGETKQRVNLSLTLSAIAALNKTAQEYDISRSELIERFARGNWVRVEDALPPIDATVLIWFKESVAIAERIENTDDTWDWWDLRRGILYPKVTHWQPQPIAPAT